MSAARRQRRPARPERARLTKKPPKRLFMLMDTDGAVLAVYPRRAEAVKHRTRLIHNFRAIAYLFPIVSYSLDEEDD